MVLEPSNVGDITFEKVQKFYGDKSPLRRALRSHFERFQGLTAPRGDDGPGGAEMHIYKDTASGNQV